MRSWGTLNPPLCRRANTSKPLHQCAGKGRRTVKGMLGHVTCFTQQSDLCKFVLLPMLRVSEPKYFQSESESGVG